MFAPIRVPKATIKCVGIDVGTLSKCYFLFILNQWINYYVRVRPSHSPSKHLSPVPRHKAFFWIILAHHR